MKKNNAVINFMVCALADINNATLDLRFFGMKRDLAYQRNQMRFEGVEYNKFQSVKFQVPERLSHLIQEEKKIDLTKFRTRKR